MLADAAKPRNDYITVFLPSKGRQMAALAAMFKAVRRLINLNEYKKLAGLNESFPGNSNRGFAVFECKRRREWRREMSRLSI